MSKPKDMTRGMEEVKPLVELAPEERLLALWAMLARWRDGGTWPTFTELMHATGLGRAEVRRLVDELEDAGAIVPAAVAPLRETDRAARLDAEDRHLELIGPAIAERRRRLSANSSRPRPCRGPQQGAR